MEKSDVRILIVEDDPTLGRGLTELFKRAGYQCSLVSNPDQAMTKTEHNEFHVLIVDCMLPKMNGVDLVHELIVQDLPKPIVILMTGVFKDKAFLRDAMTKTGAALLFNKPFSMEKMLAEVEKELQKGILDPELQPFPRLLTESDCSSEQILAALNKQKIFNGYHLPMVLSLFARQGITGDLNLVSTEKDVAQVTWIEGRIVDVRSKNPATQMGELLVESGFAFHEDVQAALSSKGADPLGKRMVNAVLLSPHAVELIREEQLTIRLSQLIQDKSLEVTWLKKKVEMNDTFHPFPPGRLKNLMSEWIISKIPQEWLRTFYGQFADRIILWRGKTALKIEGAKANLTMLPRVLERIPGRPTLQDLLVESGDKDLECLMAIHALILERKVYFGEKRRGPGDFTGRIERYKRLLATLSQKNHFQILGVSQNARAHELQTSFTDLAKQFHPDKLSPDAPNELVKLSHDIFAAISNAYNTLTDEPKRKSYLADLSRKEASRTFSFEPIFDAGIKDLESRKYLQAMRKFEDLIDRGAKMPDLRAYFLWAKAKANKSLSDRDLLDIPPEHRHSAIYALVKGLYFRQHGKIQKAMESFQHARLLDKSLREANAELLELAEDLEAKDNGLHTLIHRFVGSKSSKPKKAG